MAATTETVMEAQAAHEPPSLGRVVALMSPVFALAASCVIWATYWLTRRAFRTLRVLQAARRMRKRLEAHSVRRLAERRGAEEDVGFEEEALDCVGAKED